MPTTAGTGSEATKNAVISVRSAVQEEPALATDGAAQSCWSIRSWPSALPPQRPRAPGMDAITQLIESYISRGGAADPAGAGLDGLRLAVPAVVEAVRDGTSRRPREAMAHAALLSGMALANSGLGLAHGVAAALGVHCRVPHGLACAVMLPAALRVNRDGLPRSRAGASLARAARSAMRLRRRRAADAFIEHIDAAVPPSSAFRAAVSKSASRDEQLPSSSAARAATA